MCPSRCRLAGRLVLAVLTWALASTTAPEPGRGQDVPEPAAIAPVASWTTEGNLAGALLWLKINPKRQLL